MTHKFQELKLAFATPIVLYQIDEAERINKTILEEIGQRRAGEKGMVRSNRAGWHSDLDFFQRKEPAHRELAQAIMRSIADATRRCAAKGVDLQKMRLECDGWVNVNPDGGYNVPHDHPGAFWSAAYYVYVPPAEKGSVEGSIEFIDPRSAPPGQGLVKSPYMRGLYTMRPKAGTLVVFPSTLKHWVHPNGSTEERVTIAINAKVAMDPVKMRKAKEDQIRNALPQDQREPAEQEAKPAAPAAKAKQSAPAKAKAKV